MAKKTRKTGFDRPVTENRDYVSWELGGLEFRYAEGRLGINLCIVAGDMEYPCSFARDLKEAGYFAEGFLMCWQSMDKVKALMEAKTEGK